MKLEELINSQFGESAYFSEKRPGIQQLHLPIFHEDGDGFEIYIDVDRGVDVKPETRIRISDYGMSLMRLSYDFDLDTPNKLEIYKRIVHTNRAQERDGEIFIETTGQKLWESILQFTQVVSKVCNMRQLQREVVSKLFEEQLDQCVMGALAKFKPIKGVCPLSDREDLKVDYQINAGSHPYYLFSVKNALGARLVTICCLEFKRKQLKFTGVAVHRDPKRLGRDDAKRLMAACDKQFVSFNDFRDNFTPFFEREN